jgi:hypothetical protein
MEIGLRYIFCWILSPQDVHIAKNSMYSSQMACTAVNGYAIKKVIKIAAIIVGLFFAAMAKENLLLV